MREIKFRAWQKHHKEMCEVAAISFVSAISLGFVIKKASFGLNVETWTFDEVELMQYTGLKDKHGNEVYEGDIVKIDKYYGVVVWDTVNDGWRIRLRNTYNLRNDEMVVVGNIYDNPEVLK